jgi:hypothetical protein
VLVLAELSDREGVFEAAGRRMDAGPAAGRGERTLAPAGGLPRYPVAVLGLTLAVPALAGGRVRAGDLVRAVAVPFLAFVAGLAVVVRAAAEGADLLVVARDGDRSRLGPASLGPATRFVVDHAPCPVLLVWPEQTPAVGSIPPPPPHPPRP